MAKWSACGRGLLEDLGSNPARRYKLTIFSHRRVSGVKLPKCYREDPQSAVEQR